MAILHGHHHLNSDYQRFTLPPTSCLDALTSSCFSTLDLFGYRQVEGAEDDRGETALMTGRVLYQCTAILHLLTNDGAHHQEPTMPHLLGVFG